MIQSPCTITLTPSGGPAIILIAAGGWLETLPTFEASQNLFEADGILLGSAFFRPLGGVVMTIDLAMEQEHGNLVTALNAYLNADASLLEISGTLTFVELAVTFPDAVVAAISPALPGGPTSTVVRTLTIKTPLPN